MSKPLFKVCVYHPNLGHFFSQAPSFIGGAEFQQFLLVKGLSERGHALTVVCSEEGGGEEREVDGVRVLSGDSRSTIIGKVASLWRGLKEADADYYYVRGCFKLIIVVSLFCLWKKRRFLYALASNVNVFGYRDIGLPLWLYLLHRFNLAKASLVLVQTEHQKGLLKRNYGIDGVLLKNIFPLEERGEKASTTEKFALWVANIRPVKRPDLLMEVARLCPQVNFKVVGGVSPGEESYGKKIIKEIKAIENIEYLGFQKREVVESLIESSLAILNTTIGKGNKDIEGFPNTYLQAWNKSVPVVTLLSNPDGIISKNKLGFCSQSVEMMAGHIKKIKESPDLAEEMGKNGWKYVEREHSLEKNLDNLEGILSRLKEDSF